jgi:hypothetical protein
MSGAGSNGPPDPDRLGRHAGGVYPLADQYLVAQLQALSADPPVAGRRHSRYLIAALAAEAALFGPCLITDHPDRGDGRADCPAGFGYDRVRATHASVADVRMRPGD